MEEEKEKRILFRKTIIETELREINDLLMLIVRKPDNSTEYQRNIILLLRNIASIRERMLSDISADPAVVDISIKNEIAILENRARALLFSINHGTEATMASTTCDSDDSINPPSNTTTPCQGQSY